MGSITFDTLSYAKKLKAVGVPEAQAEAQAEAIAEAMSANLATKTDISDIKGELKLLRWMVGTLIALCVTILFKIFSH